MFVRRRLHFAVFVVLISAMIWLTSLALAQSGDTVTYTGDPGPFLNATNNMNPLGPSMITEVEPNGTVATANTLTGDSAVVMGNVNPNGDLDYYAITAQAGDRVYAAIMTSFSSAGSTDSQLRVFASDGTTLIEFDEDDGSFAGFSSSIAGATLPTAGTYYLLAQNFSATAQMRPYYLYLRLQRGTPTAEVESNNTPATANALPANGWVSGTRDPAAATEQDWYAFSANAGDTVYLSLDLDPERDAVQWNGRLGIALFGDAGNQILVVDDATAGSAANPLSEAHFMTIKDAGTYYAFVDSASAATGGPTATYNLSVTIFPAANEGVNCTTYTSTNVPQPIGPAAGLVSSTITVPGNPRIADLDVSIQLNHALMGDIDAHLRSPAGNDNGLFTDIGAGATGGQTQMDITIDDEAAIPFAFTVLRGLVVKPELAYRLSWFDGENAGGTWTLDLRDDLTNASGGTLTGWSIRICEQPPVTACPAGSAVTTIYSTDFESGAAGFTHNGAADEWELGLPNTAGTTTANPIAPFNTCNSGTNCWKTDLDNTYDINSSQNLVSPGIDLSTANLVGPVHLSWAQRYQIETANFDHAWVDVQQVGGATPRRLWEWLDGNMTDAPGSPVVNIGASAGWGVYNRDISSYLGQNIELLFHLDTDSSVNFAGMAIDDVTVTACLLLPTSTPTSTPTNTPTSTPTNTPTNTPTSTPTSTTTNTPTATGTATPTDVPTSTPTDTPPAPTATPTVPPTDVQLTGIGQGGTQTSLWLFLLLLVPFVLGWRRFRQSQA